ncbi:MAG: protein phosphatase 2C domain-containing protein [Dysgonamonadaceae bacterium]|jgi:serine/threonine protein phosphatase PrpC|nr:protein phosphatase 2C domain-containing protein [Dysgonamonadaceae bacterium]
MKEYNKKTEYSGQTNKGKVRTENEDAFAVQTVWDKNHILAVVIDGVGGYKGGKVAAGIAQKVIPDYLKRYPNGERLELLKQAVTEANNRIFEEACKEPDLSNMCCVLTAVIVEIEKKQINMVHIGDTRLYQYHNWVLQKLSHDHSLVGYREEIGDLTEEQAMNHPQRNVIGRDVGSSRHETDDKDFIEAAVFPLLPNSMLMLCSDGLCDMLKSDEMAQILQQNISVYRKINALISLANEKGGKDNITVALVDYRSDEPQQVEEQESDLQEDANPTEETKTAETAGSNGIKLWIVACLLAAALIIGLAGGWFGRGLTRPAEVATDSVKVATDTLPSIDSIKNITTDEIF